MSEQSRANNPVLVLHHTGKALPKYSQTTLKNIGKRWPGRIVLLNNISSPVNFPFVEDEKYDSWYEGELFQRFAQKSEMEESFRDGFWLHAIERFFLLAQWQEMNQIDNFLHIEMDVLIFDTQASLKRLDDFGSGIFLPRASETQAGANWMYVNQASALRELLGFFIENAGAEFEMPLLAQFLQSRSDIAHAVPTHALFEMGSSSDAAFKVVPLDVMTGVVDVHPMGTWIFGQDPRNIPKEPVFNHFYFDELGSPAIESLHYRYFLANNSLQVGIRGREHFPIFALHVHSKVMKRAHSRLGLLFYVFLSNRKYRSIVVMQNVPGYLFALIRRIVDRTYSRLKLQRVGNLLSGK